LSSTDQRLTTRKHSQFMQDKTNILCFTNIMSRHSEEKYIYSSWFMQDKTKMQIVSNILLQLKDLRVGKWAEPCIGLHKRTQ